MNWSENKLEDSIPVKTKGSKAKFNDRNENTSIKSKKMKFNNKNENDNHTNSKERINKKSTMEVETDPSVLQRRQKQIDYGKNTVGYTNYIQQVSIDQRSKDHPITPDKYCKYSRRSWDTLIKIWRKKLHEYDPNASENDKIELDT